MPFLRPSSSTASLVIKEDHGFAAFEFDFDMRGGRTLMNFLDLAFEKIARGYFQFIFSYG